MIFLVCSFARAIVRRFSFVVVLLLLGACSPDSVEPQSVTPASNGVDSLSSNSAPYGVQVAIDKASFPEALPSQAKLFVFLRQPGQRMPLAVEQFSPNQIPKLVTFAPASAPEQVELVVRLSPSGKVNRASEDLQIEQMVSLTHPPQAHRVSFDQQPASNKDSTEQRKLARIALSYDIEERPDTSWSVFVIAKSADSPIPLAVKQVLVQDLPTTVVLSQNDSMLPSRNIDTVRHFKLSARISRSGGASREPGDWESDNVAFESNDVTHELTIYKKVTR